MKKCAKIQIAIWVIFKLIKRTGFHSGWFCTRKWSFHGKHAYAVLHNNVLSKRKRKKMRNVTLDQRSSVAEVIQANLKISLVSLLCRRT